MINRVFFLICFFSISILSCKKDDDNNSIDAAQLTTGTWKVTLFSERGENESSDFNGYIFTFNSNGTITATQNTTTKTGAWSAGSKKFNIDLGAKSDNNKPLGELTDDWNIISQNANEIRLKDDNDNSAELLTFSKN